MQSLLLKGVPMHVLRSQPPERISSNAPQGRIGSWSERWIAPPPEVVIITSPQGALAPAAREIAERLRPEPDRGRSAACTLRDEEVHDRVGGFDGRALLPHCVEGLDR
jgi:hypothetical protein